MQIMRRRTLFGITGVLLGAAGLGARVLAQPAERMIKIVAKKFDYTPNVIKLKKGEAVLLELTTQDVVMGFNAPDFGVRADIIPGKVAQVRLNPQMTGQFTFFCDIFCGTGHEDMNGTIVVEA